MQRLDQPLHWERKGAEMKAKLMNSIRSKRGMDLQML